VKIAGGDRQATYGNQRLQGWRQRGHDRLATARVLS
jgi:hypothetical protein